jgi:hypothetical protein
MQIVGLRTYRVKPADFPIQIIVAARNLPTSRVVVSVVHILIAGNPGGTIEVKPVDNATALTTSYSIRRPAQLTSADLVQTIHATFGATAPANSRYEITITSSTGDTATTTISRPTIDPGFAVLVFQLR